MGGKVSKNIVGLEPLASPPTDAELAELGGRYFTRPSDGKRLEYFVLNGVEDGEESSGSPTPPRVRAVVNLITTNATGHMYHIWKPDEVLPILRQYNAQLINISTAGVGPSEPYGDRLDDPNLSVTQYLEQTSSDVVALLTELGIQEVYTLGVSGGWEPSAHLAATLAKQTSDDEKSATIQIKGVSCVRGIPWMTSEMETESFWESSFGTSRWKKSLVTWFMYSSMNPHVMNMMFPMKPEQFKSYMPDYEDLVTALGSEDLLKEMCLEGNRANAHWLFVASFLGRLTCALPNDRVDVLADLAALREVPVYLHLSVKDEMVPYDKVKPYLMRKLPHAKELNDEQKHVIVPFVDAITELLKQT